MSIENFPCPSEDWYRDDITCCHNCRHCHEVVIKNTFMAVRELTWDIAELRNEEEMLLMCHASDGKDTEEIKNLLECLEYEKELLRKWSESYTKNTGLTMVLFHDNGRTELLKTPIKHDGV